MKLTLIIHGTIVTVNPNREIIHDGAILIEDDRIGYVGHAEELRNTRADETIDASGQIVLPGLINCHTHTAYYLMRNLGMDRDVFLWLRELAWPWLLAMDEQDAYIGSLLGYVECLKSGTTCLIDNQNYPTCSNHLYDHAVQAAIETGLRVTFACGFQDIRFHSPPDLIDTPEGIEAECRRLIATWHGQGLINMITSPINLLYCSENLVHRFLRIMEETGTGMHTHVAEDEHGANAIIKRFGKGYLEVFHDLGALGDFFQSVHSIWVSDLEIELLAKAGASVVYNPTSNMLLSAGIAPITKMQAAGVNVALGTDNPNNNNDMIEGMKFASLLQKLGTKDPLAAPAVETLEMATINGARALHMEEEIGSLEKGKKADIVVINARRPHNTPLLDPVATLVYSANGGDVEQVWVNGEHLLRNGEVTFLDEIALIDEAQGRAEALARRAGNAN